MESRETTDGHVEMTKAEVARFYRISTRTLERWARAGIGPRQIPRGPRLVRYDSAEVHAYGRDGERRESA